MNGTDSVMYYPLSRRRIDDFPDEGVTPVFRCGTLCLRVPDPSLMGASAVQCVPLSPLNAIVVKL